MRPQILVESLNQTELVETPYIRRYNSARKYRGTIMFKSAIAAVAAAPFLATAAFAGPYVESKTTAAGVITDGGDFTGAQTELRVGYEQKASNGVTVFGEIGPGYEWNNGGTDEGVAVGEVGVNFPIANNLTGKFKVAGEYGFDSEVFALGGELKVRYSF